jgi:HlyD family secretion protein
MPLLLRLSLGGLLLLAACQAEESPDTLTASGTVEATEVRVATRLGGQVVRLLVEEGSRVSAGDTVAVLDHDGMMAQTAQAEAGVDVAVAQLNQLRSGARAEDIRAAQAQLQQAETNLDLARQDARRIHQLLAEGSATAKQQQDADGRVSIAEAQVNTAVEQLRKLQQLVRPEELRTAEARVAQARTAVEQARILLEDAWVLAPTAGTVTEQLVEEGEVVGNGGTLLTLARLDEVYLTIYVTTEEMARVRLGQAAQVSVDGYPGRTFEGRVTWIADEAEFTPKNVQTKDERVRQVFRVRITLPNPDGTLKPGLPADAVLRE